MNEKKYIYNPKQADFYIRHGVLPLNISIHKKTNKIFWVFGKEESYEVYDAWCKLCEDYKKNINI